MAEQEQILLQGIKNSDKTAFHQLFSDFHDTLFRFVAYRVQDGDLAEDITQETFLRVWRKRESIQPEKSFSGRGNFPSGEKVPRLRRFCLVFP